MKKYFTQISDLATFAKHELSSAQDTLDKTLSAAAEVGKASKEALVSRVDKSVELIQSVGDTDFAKSVVDITKNITFTTSHAATKLSDQFEELTTRNTSLGNETITTKDSNDADDLNYVIEKLKGKDKVGLSGEALAVTGGGLAGVAAAGTLASAAGATTILGSTSLASVLGGTFVAATPVGWVVCAAVVAGATGYGIAKMVRSGSKQDQVREQLIKRLKARLALLTKEGQLDSPLSELNQLLAVVIEKGLISEVQAERMVGLIESGALNINIALQRLKSLG
ncbi:MAG: hypothetical protein QX191_05625 [Methylococcaceae bacterium]